MTIAAILSATAANVVSNHLGDEQQTTATPVQGSLVKVLEALETERVTWEQGAYRTSNQALYAVLAKCLAIATVDTMELVKQRNAALEAFYKERGYQYKADIHPATRVVKAVFGGVDRRRLSTYSLVLRQAIKEKVGATNLAQWIEEKGGLQEIRLGQSATYVSPKNKAASAREKFDSLPELATVKTEALSLLADASFAGNCCVLVAEQTDKGSFVVRAMTRADGAVNAAFAALYGEYKKAA